LIGSIPQLILGWDFEEVEYQITSTWWDILRALRVMRSPISQIFDIFSIAPIPGASPLLHGMMFLNHLSRLTNLIPSLIRLSITLIFVSSFFLQSAQRPIMTLWARVIESDKPVFTMLFGGIAAIARVIQQIIGAF
jgi:hypothetical protein